MASTDAATIAAPLTVAGAGAGMPRAVNVHTVVLMSILDHHTRRSGDAALGNDGGARVVDRGIGVLLGSISAGGVVDITGSFGVPHLEREDEVRVQSQEPINVHRRLSDKEQIVGWYATSGPDALLDAITVSVHKHFEEIIDLPRPVHLCVDTRLSSDRIDTRAFVRGAGVGVTKEAVDVFQEVKCNVVATPEARVAIDAILRATSTASTAGGAALPPTADVQPELGTLETSMKRLRDLLDSTLSYVDDVVAGKREGDEAIGRAIGDTLASVPAVDAAGFERSFTTALRDVLMSSYLTSITAAQMKLAERIAAVVPTAGERDRVDDGEGRRGGAGAGRGGRR